MRHLRRLRSLVEARRVDAQVTEARLLLHGRALGDRLRTAQDFAAEQLANNGLKAEVCNRLHTERMAKVATDLGFTVEGNELKNFLASQVDSTFRKELQEKQREREEAKSAAPPPPAPLTQIANETKTCVAAVIPFRGRTEHLRMFYEHMAKFLQDPRAAQLCWSFFIVEQYDTSLFNRGWLFNVGFTIAQAEARKFKCIVIQDLDTLPEVGAPVNFSDCDVPTQFSSEIECYGWLPPYATNAGGVVGMRAEHWRQINGFSNQFDGWGGEDDDLRLRLRQTDLLRGDCGDFCHLTDRAFQYNQKLIKRPHLGSGRFICLDEKSHTARKHGDKDRMHQHLQAMEMDSDRWTADGLSDLQFELIRHDRRPFPHLVPRSGDPDVETQAGNAELHWLKVVKGEGFRYNAQRIRFVLSQELCEEACARKGLCRTHPGAIPFSFEELRREFAIAFAGCTRFDKISDVAFWLINRDAILTPIADNDLKDAKTSMAINEVVREALATPVDGEPVLVVRGVPARKLSAGVREMHQTPSRLQLHQVDVCVGIFRLQERHVKLKHTVNVGSDDCEQRSWTHFLSFHALREPRSSQDYPICVGQADGTWQARVERSMNCSGKKYGISWLHMGVFYMGTDGAGETFCVRFKEERLAGSKQWTRWQIVRPHHGVCDHPKAKDGFHTQFTFRSMEDLYQPPRTSLCTRIDRLGRMEAFLGCNPQEEHNVSAYFVLRSEQVELDDEIHCIGRNRDSGDRITRADNCNVTEESGQSWEHVGLFGVPVRASGRPWCAGRRKTSDSRLLFRTLPQASCSGDGFEGVLSLREVSMDDLTEDHGVLSYTAQ